VPLEVLDMHPRQRNAVTSNLITAALAGILAVATAAVPRPIETTGGNLPRFFRTSKGRMRVE
jgi:hypothetical protein